MSPDNQSILITNDQEPTIENIIDDHFIEKVSAVLTQERDKIRKKRLEDEKYRYIANGICTLTSGTIYATYPTGWRRLTKKTNKYGTR